jgi:hypothetical protein
VTVRTEVSALGSGNDGRVTVDACVVEGQIDERISVGTCGGGAARVLRLAPAGRVAVPENAVITPNCAPARDWRRGRDDDDDDRGRGRWRDRDEDEAPAPVPDGGETEAEPCVIVTCQDPNDRIEEPPPDDPNTPEDESDVEIEPADAVACPRAEGGEPNSAGAIDPDRELARNEMIMRPAVGTATLEHVVTGDRIGPLTLTAGRASFAGVAPGRYRAIIDAPGATRIWRSKSLPSSGAVLVEPGVHTRAVRVFRPEPTGVLRLRFRTHDWSNDLEPSWVDGWPEYVNGVLTDMAWTERLCLVPRPLGRLVRADVPCFDVPRTQAAVAFTAPGIEPGMYEARVSNEWYSGFWWAEETSGFIFVGEDGSMAWRDDTSDGSGSVLPTISNSLCSDQRRQIIRGVGAALCYPPYDGPAWVPGRVLPTLCGGGTQ